MAKRELKKASKIKRMFKILAYRKKNTDRECPVRQICSGFMYIVIIRMIGTYGKWLEELRMYRPGKLLSSFPGFFMIVR